MSEQLNYKTGLLYLYKLMAGSDGKPERAEFDMAWDKMKKAEKISPADWNKYLFSDFGNKEVEYKKCLEVLNRCGAEKRTRALAWMKKIMYADGERDVRELHFYRQLRKDLNVQEQEVAAMLKKINAEKMITV
jgi:uncharacterized tellurite resistance protein B-like protein